MADDQIPNDDTPTPPLAAPAPQPAATGSPTITPDVQALIDAAARDAAQKAHNAAWKQARETFAAKGQKGGSPQPAPAEPAAPAAPDVSAEIARFRAFDRTLGRFALSDKARELTEREFLASKPSDPAAWLSERAEAYGWNLVGGGAPAAPAAAPPAAPPVPQSPARAGLPITDRAPPPPPAVVTDDTPIMSMSATDREALRRKVGDLKFAERWLAESRNVRIKPPGQ